MRTTIATIQIQKVCASNRDAYLETLADLECFHPGFLETWRDKTKGVTVGRSKEELLKRSPSCDPQRLPSLKEEWWAGANLRASDCRDYLKKALKANGLEGAVTITITGD